MKVIKTIKKQALLNETIKVINSYTQKLTLRQIYYRLVAKHIIQNEYSQYKRLSKLLVEARKKGLVPFDAMEDRTREIINNSVINYDSWRDELNHLIKWIKNPKYYLPENLYQPKINLILLEKQALEGIFRSAIDNNTILVVCKGYNSLTQLYELSELLGEDHREIHCGFFSDYDPSGIDIQRNFKEQSIELGIEFDSFKRIALTKDLIKKYALPYAPTKRKDSRAKDWEDKGVVELDALEPNVLEQMIQIFCSKNWDNEIETRKNRLKLILERRYKKALAKNLKLIVKNLEGENYGK